jgi:hypothetical protein
MPRWLSFHTYPAPHPCRIRYSHTDSCMFPPPSRILIQFLPMCIPQAKVTSQDLCNYDGNDRFCKLPQKDIEVDWVTRTLSGKPHALVAKQELYSMNVEGSFVSRSTTTKDQWPAQKVMDVCLKTCCHALLFLRLLLEPDSIVKTYLFLRSRLPQLTVIQNETHKLTFQTYKGINYHCTLEESEELSMVLEGRRKLQLASKIIASRASFRRVEAQVSDLKVSNLV